MHSTHVSVFHRTAIRVAVRGALSLSAVLGLGLGITVVPPPTPAAASPSTSTSTSPNTTPDTHPDFDHDALLLSTTTDTLPEDTATHFEAIAGDQVRRIYYIHNRGLLPLDNVTVSDPGANGATIHCGPSGTHSIPVLLPLAWATCSATFTAESGEHHTTVTASGTLFLFDVTLTDEDDTGYTAVVPALSAALSLNGPATTSGGQPGANLPAGKPVPTTVTVLNTGSVTLTQLTPTPQPPLSISNCGHDGPAIHELNPGESAACVGLLAPAPGSHVSSVTITGEWRWDHPITEQGPQTPEDLTVQTVAEAPYTGIPVSSPTPPPSPARSTPAPPPPTPAPPPPSPAVVIPPPPLPSPSPSPTPSHHPTPTPTPTQVAVMLQQAVSQFQARRELPLPLKVLVIIIIPAAAAAAGARRIASSRR